MLYLLNCGLALLTCGLLITSVQGQTLCRKLNSCSCAFSNTTIIDLSPLGYSNGTARWQDKWDQYYSLRYSYNPCYSFSENNCTNVSVCQFDGYSYYTLGVQESAQFTTHTATAQVTIVYNSTDITGFNRTTQVELQCIYDGPSVFEAIGETSLGNYRFVLKSSDACPKTV